MMRSVLAVVVGFISMAAFVFVVSIAPWFILGLDRVLVPGRYDTTVAYNVYGILVAFVGAILGGWICAHVGRSRNAVIVLAALSFLAGMGNALGHISKPDPGVREPGVTEFQVVARRKEPAGFSFPIVVLGCAGVLLGGRRAGSKGEIRREYATSVRIRSTPEAVWNILTDSAGYAAWNSEVVDIEGRMDSGARIKVRVRLGDGAVRTVPMQITTFSAPEKLEWKGGLPMGLFVGRRTFTITPCGDEVEFSMRLSMAGPLAPLILKRVGDRQPEVDSFSASLKASAEQATTFQHTPCQS